MPLKTKYERAKKVIEKMELQFKEFSLSNDKNDNLAFKKTSLIINNAKKKVSEISSSDLPPCDIMRETIAKVTELSGKIYNNLEKASVPEKGRFLKELNAWMNEIKFIVLVDIDDTIRDSEQRQGIMEKIHKLRDELSCLERGTEFYISLAYKMDSLWDGFYKFGKYDEPRNDVIKLTNHLYEKGFTIKIRTGGTELYKADTIAYLKKHGVKYHELRMRKDNVRIPSSLLKPSWITKYDGAENVFISYDDNEKVNEKYIKKGVVDVVLVTKDFDPVKHLNDIKRSIEKASVFLTAPNDSVKLKTFSAPKNKP